MNLMQLVLPKGLYVTYYLSLLCVAPFVFTKRLFFIRYVRYMKVLVNGKVQELAAQSSVKNLVLEMQLPDKGVAVAVNNKIVPHNEWDSFILNDNDTIIIIKAACGG